MSGLTYLDWERVERALLQRYGLKDDWYMARAYATKTGRRYYVTLRGPEGKEIGSRGLVSELLEGTP
jgi:hypothetical protein